MQDPEDQIVALFEELPAARMSSLIDRLELSYAGKFAAEMEAARLMMRELQTLREPKASAGPLPRTKPTAKYRSFKNPELTWAGRGTRAAWLIKEMEESGLPLEAFLITGQ
jgi:DNA-binding protein H-NS